MVVDTMVVAFALIGEADLHQQAVRVLGSRDELWAPESLRAELVNVLWLWVRHRGISPESARTALRNAESLLTGFVPIAELWESALDLALARDHSPYDTLFVALARKQGTTVVTDDGTLLRRFPEWTTPLAY
ncbi:MAG TPA: type II toxin-antitoxin system VapC family toxin [Thermoanaerobaculia bacterium]|nr:type II toxin-antitoxin system VapC family toxin [Thermoanaerobaculia bacterium]